MKDIDKKKMGKIFKKNKKISEDLAYSYYQSLLDQYQNFMEEDTKENIGFNAFTDGIQLGLDITLTMVDDQTRKAIEEKIKSMIKHRKQDEFLRLSNEFMRKYKVKSKQKKVSS